MMASNFNVRDNQDNDREENPEEPEEDDVAVEKMSTWYIFAHVLDKVITISCGDGSQRVQWLAHAAIGQFSFLSIILIIIPIH